jgi:hypothetical protein
MQGSEPLSHERDPPGMQHMLCRSYVTCSVSPVDKEQLEPVASHLITAYQDTAVYSRWFLEQQKTPPTLMAKVHNLRATLQALLAHDDRYQLLPQYAEFGKVGFTEAATKRELLLRSSRAVKIDSEKDAGQLELDIVVPKPVYRSDVQMVIYQFTNDGVILSVAGAVQHKGSRRLEVAGEPEYVGMWPYLSDDHEADPFDQTGTDDFGDIGDLGDEDEDEGEDSGE